MLIILAVSLGLTLLLELGFALLCGVKQKRELLVVFLVNVLTNPAVVLLHYAARLWGWPVLPVTLALECAAVAVEWLCYRACSRTIPHPFRFALAANAFSYGVGCLINLL